MAKTEDHDCCDMEETKAARRTVIVQDFARDNSSLAVKNPRGARLAGDRTNVAHSLKGVASVAQDKSKSGAL
jgi:hypothetical protein